jgi:hypothetical protein
MSGSDARDPAASLRETCARIRPIGPIVAVCVGGLATLLGMELCEQVCDLGQFTGVADALGGNAAAGLAIIAVVATIVTVSSLRSAHVLLARAVAVAYAVMFWIVAGRRVGDPVITIRRIASHREVCALALRERGFGMRAPPLQANVFP